MDRYVLGERLGTGGFGSVYRAFDRERGDDVALKLLHPGSESEATRLLQEFRALRDLVHPNLVHLYELWATQDLWFFTMELVAGPGFLEFATGSVDTSREHQSGVRERSQTLTLTALGEGGTSEAVPRRAPVVTQPVDPKRLDVAFSQLAQGLLALHERGKVHCDIKPSNVLVSGRGVVQLADFGTVTEIGGEDRGGRFHGTPAYAAPEQIGGGGAEPADWYAVGCVLYQVLTGRLPFLGSNEQTLIAKQQQEAFRPVCANAALAPYVELAMGLLRREPAARPVARQVLDRFGVLTTPAVGCRSSQHDASEPFVGREQELKSLKRWVNTGGAIFRIHGESGVGKSALMRHAAELLAAVSVSTSCPEREHVPFQALGELFQGLIDAEPSCLDAVDERQQAALGRLLPGLSLDGSCDDSPNLRRTALGAMRGLLRSFGEVVWLVDDAQWADADSLSLLAELLDAPQPGIRLVVSTRPAPGPSTDWLSSRSDVERLDLGPLAPIDAAALAFGVLTREPGAEADETNLRSRARELALVSLGHPLFLHELSRAGTRYGDQHDLDQLLIARLSEVTPEDRNVVQVLAVAGEPLRLPLLATVIGEAAPALERRLALMAEQRLVRTASTPRGVFAETYHDRVARAALRLGGAQVERALHRRLAQALVEKRTADEGRLAKHLAAAGELERAAKFALLGAEKARSALAFERELTLLRLALRSGTHTERERHGLELAIANALSNCRRGMEAAEHFLRLADASPERERLRLFQRAAEQFLIAGYTERGLRLLEAVLKELDRPLPRTPWLGLAQLGVDRLLFRLRGRRYRERPLSQVDERDLLRLDALRTAAFGLGMVDNLRAAGYHTRQVMLALEIGEPNLVGRALAAETIFAGSRWTRGRDAWRCLEESKRISARQGTPLLRAWSEGADAILRMLSGEVADNVSKLREVELAFEEHTAGTSWELNSVRMFRGLGLRFLGHYSELMVAMQGHLRDAERRSDRFLETTLRRASSVRLLAADEPDLAQAELDASTWSDPTRGFHLQHFWELEGRAELDMYRGQAGDALERHAEWLRLHRRSLNTAIEVVRALDLYLRIRLHLSRRVAHPRHSLLAARALASRLGLAHMSYARVWTALGWAGIAACEGRNADAQRRLLEAERVASEWGLDWLREVSRLRRGQSVGGTEGAQLMATARARARALGVANPAKLVDVFAPGFASTRDT